VRLCLLLTLTLALVNFRGSSARDIIDEVHTQSLGLRKEMLREWTFPPSGYLATFAAAPVQHVVAALFLNENATAVQIANNIMLNMSSTFNSCYEWTTLIRAFVMFNSRSDFPDTARLVPEAEQRLQKHVLTYANASVSSFCDGRLPSAGGNAWCTKGSENLDIDFKTSSYLGLATLAKDPEYANQRLAPAKIRIGNHSSHTTALTVAQAAEAWEEYFYIWLRDHAVSGIFTELGSPNYWYRTWPAVFNLVDMGSPRIRQRAKMFLDLATLDGEQMAVNGFRGGAKMRAKKDGGDYPVYNTTADPIVVYQAGQVR
jgi:hypothetical protein